MTQRTSPLVRTAHVGLGPIGRSIVRVVAAKPWATVVGGVDIAPGLIGRDIGIICEEEATGIRVASSLSEAGAPGAADVVVHCAGSHLDDGVADQVIQALEWGANVVSTCEELSYPWFHHPDVARRIDETARANGRSVLATGINPGFAMDALAIFVSGISADVRGVHIQRRQDAGQRREPLQRKVGASVSASEFASRKAEGRIGHVGLRESVALLDRAFGYEIDRIEESLEPAIAETRLTTPYLTLEPGCVAGIMQTARGYKGDRELITLELQMSVGVPNPGDTIRLEGRPEVTVAVDGLHGDVCTAAIIANAIPFVMSLSPGLATMLDAAPLRYA